MDSRGQTMIGHVARAVLGILAAASLTACGALPERPQVSADAQAGAVVPGFENARLWEDDPAGAWNGWRARAAAQRARAGRTGRLEMLAISSGADKGAFTAGYLGGWSEAGTRPQFDIVSGVSTGALIAPFAFLGQEYDPRLEELYTGINARMIYRMRTVQGLLGGPALATTEPLAELIERYAEKAVIDRISEEHARGRRLLVMTANLDAQRGVVWDMGAIASSDSADRYALFRKVLLASASIPGFFPPVLIDVVNGQQRFSELHVDGGAVSSVLAIPPAVAFEDQANGTKVDARLTLLYNGALGAVHEVVEPDAFSIIERALFTAIKQADQGEILILKQYAQETGLVLDIESIGPEAEQGDQDLFDQEFMRKLYRRGRERGLDR
jgi:predicted acylesterase/phospholipase RssA